MIMVIHINKNIDEIMDELPLVQKLYFLNSIKNKISLIVGNGIKFECAYKGNNIVLIVKNAIAYKKINNYIDELEKIFTKENLPLPKIIIIP
jgi:hypothetical protein